MKEKIYTIPINEAYDTDCECPLCLLEDKLERDALEYNLGAAMMEEDFRYHSDKTGYCRRHFSMLYEMPNKLPLALVLDTHMQAVRKAFSAVIKHAPKEGAKEPLLGKKDRFAGEVSACLKSITDGCVVCEKIDGTMERYIDVLLYMWDKDEDFKSKFESSKGMCLRHMLQLAKTAHKSLGSKASGFLGTLARKEEKELERIQADIHKFTQKFDYRNKDMDWGTAKDAPIRTIEKLTGYVKSRENKDD